MSDEQGIDNTLGKVAILEQALDVHLYTAQQGRSFVDELEQPEETADGNVGGTTDPGPTQRGSGRSGPGMVPVPSGEDQRGKRQVAAESSRSAEPYGPGANDTRDHNQRAIVTLGTEISQRAFEGGQYPSYDRRWRGIAITIGAVSVLLIGIALIPLLTDVILPPPFVYMNSPFPVCETDSPGNDCTIAGPDFVFHPGDVVPLLVSRCYNEPFVRSNAKVGYRIERSLVSDHDGITINMAPTFNEVDNGCTTTVVTLHAVPNETPNGAYHFEGASTVYGTFRTVTVVWRSKSFKVEHDDSTPKESP